MLDSPARHLDQAHHFDPTHLDPAETAAPAADPPLRRSLAHRLCKLCSPAVAADHAFLANTAVVMALALATHFLYFGGFFPSRLKLDDYVLIGLAIGLAYFIHRPLRLPPRFRDDDHGARFRLDQRQGPPDRRHPLPRRRRGS